MNNRNQHRLPSDSSFKSFRVTSKIINLTLFYVLVSLYQGQGSISPNFFRQAKSCRRTAFVEKFHQKNVSQICAPFAKNLCAKIRQTLFDICQNYAPFAEFCAKKSFSYCARKKVARAC